jgi:hypothetical protein
VIARSFLSAGIAAVAICVKVDPRLINYFTMQTEMR